MARLKRSIVRTVLVALGYILFILMLFLLVIYAYWSHEYPENHGSWNYLLHDVTSHNYANQQTFSYDGYKITAVFASEDFPQNQDDCNKMVSDLKKTTYWTKDLEAERLQKCLDGNQSRLEYSKNKTKIRSKITFNNITSRLRSTSSYSVSIVDFAGKTLDICDGCADFTRDKVLPKGSSFYTIEMEAPKDTLFNLLLKAPNKATQIVHAG